MIRLLEVRLTKPLMTPGYEGHLVAYSLEKGYGLEPDERGVLISCARWGSKVLFVPWPMLESAWGEDVPESSPPPASLDDIRAGANRVSASVKAR